MSNPRALNGGPLVLQPYPSDDRSHFDNRGPRKNICLKKFKVQSGKKTKYNFSICFSIISVVASVFYQNHIKVAERKSLYFQLYSIKSDWTKVSHLESQGSTHRQINSERIWALDWLPENWGRFIESRTAGSRCSVSGCLLLFPPVLKLAHGSERVLLRSTLRPQLQ